MAVTAFWYAGAFVQAFDKEVDFLADTIKCALTTSSYSPDQDTHDYFNDVTNEVSATGYTAGGATLANKANSNTNNVVSFDADDVTWSNSTITARRAVYYDSTGTSSTSALLWWVDFGEDKASSSGDFTIQHHASGIATVTATDATGFP